MAAHNHNNDQTAATREDLRYLRDSLVEEMRDGFKGVYERQDKTNGRVLKTEYDVIRIDERLKGAAESWSHAVKNIETIFGMLDSRTKARRSTDEQSEAATFRRQRRYSQKALIGGAAAAAVAISEAMQRIVPALIEAFK
jgi:hemin uptake protein HemP